MPEATVLHDQYVAHHADGRYTVRTFAITLATPGKLATRSMIKEVPARLRDIAQATIDDRVVEIGEVLA
jgi:hypothetical protein